MNFNDVGDSVSGFAQKFVQAIKSEPVFCFYTGLSYILFIFHITAASGGWVTYNKGGNQEVKIGLFNSAVNGKWVGAPYSQCVKNINGTIEQEKINERLMFCNALLSNGIMEIISLLVALLVAGLLSYSVANNIEQGKMLLTKTIAICSFSFTAVSNLISFTLGAGILFRLTNRDYNPSFYGVGFGAAVFNWILSMFLAIGGFFLIDVNGFITRGYTSSPSPVKTIPRVERSAWKRFSNLP